MQTPSLPVTSGDHALSSRPAPRFWLLHLSLGVLAMAAMAGAATGPFLFDDRALIHGNHYVHGFEHYKAWFTGTLWDTNYDPSVGGAEVRYWRPFVLASYAVDWWLGSGSALAFHVTNTLIHVVNASLLFQVSRAWVQSSWAAWAGAALFAVHPVQTEPVAFIAGRTDSMCLLGMLVAVLGIRAARASWIGSAVLQVVGLCLAFGSKEAAVVFPVLAFIELWSREHAPLEPRALLRPLRGALPYLGLSLVSLAGYSSLLHAGDDARSMELARRLVLILEAWGRYGALVLWPDDLTFGRALLRYDAAGPIPTMGYVVLGGVVLLGVLPGAWLLRRRHPAAALGLLAYGAMLLPVSGIVWLRYYVLVSPRFLYLPMVGLAIAFAAALAAVRSRQVLAAGACAVLLLACSVRSFVRASDYESEERLWRVEITQNPTYQPAQQFFVVRELAAGRPGVALRLAHAWYRREEETRGLPENKAELILNASQALLALTRDVDRESLRAIGRFAASLARGEEGSLELPGRQLALRAGADPGMRAAFLRASRRLAVIAAEAASRSGDDREALEAIERATAGCEQCWTVLSSAAMAAARVGALPLARSLAQNAASFGPPGNTDAVLEALEIAGVWDERRKAHPSPVSEAGYYTALGAYGRAYAAAGAALADPPRDPSGLRMLVELAFRAGDVETARRWLGASLPEQQVRAILDELSHSVHWLDRPVEDTWVPPEGAR